MWTDEYMSKMSISSFVKADVWRAASRDFEMEGLE